MRELKFRAWRNIDGRLRRYVFSPFAYEYPDPDEPVFHAEHGVNDIRDFMPLADIIEQYTGLRDKNGKEIYEGDIIHRGALPKVNVFRNSVIRFDEESVGFIATSTRNGARTLFNGHTCDEIEVIGNIHENPELLEEEEC